jgi:hypothetical protein
METPPSASAGRIAEQSGAFPAPPFFQAVASPVAVGSEANLLKGFGLIHGPKMMKGEKHE